MTAQLLPDPIVAHCVWCPATEAGFDAIDVHDRMERHYADKHTREMSMALGTLLPGPRGRVYVYCARGHEMVSGPPHREAKLIEAADEDGCGYGGCRAKRARIDRREAKS